MQSTKLNRVLSGKSKNFPSLDTEALEVICRKNKYLNIDWWYSMLELNFNKIFNK